jgi:hypothetical protein
MARLSEIQKEQKLLLLRDIAASRGGKLISTEYVKNDHPLLFEDAAGNRFPALPLNVERGSWSPYEGRVSEAVCRQAFEHIFKSEFPLRRDILRRPGKRCLELDGFAENVTINGQHVDIGMEYHGPHHFGRAAYATDEEQLKVQEHDRERRQLCADMGIILIEVEEFDSKRGYNPAYVLEHVIKHIKSMLDLHGLSLPIIEPGFEINLTNINDGVRILAEMREYAEKQSGKLISTAYLNAETPLIFEDAKSNQFPKRTSEIRSGAWSPYESNCVRDKDYHYAELRRIVEENGGILISPEYLGAFTKLQIMDADGWVFSQCPDALKAGKWSPRVSRNGAKHLSEVAQIADVYGCKLISTTYIDNKTSLLFTDQFGLPFEATSMQVKAGKVAQFKGRAGKSQEYQLSLAQYMAALKGGELISERITSSGSPLLMRDVSGNEFLCSLDNLRQGKWSRHESRKFGALVTESEDGNSRHVKTKDGNEIIYEATGDKLKWRIAAHFSPDGLQHRVWSYDVDPRNPIISTYRRAHKEGDWKIVSAPQNQIEAECEARPMKR